MRQPTCVFVESSSAVQIAEITDSARPRTRDSEYQILRSCPLSRPRTACPAAGTIGAVPFRVAVTRRARRNTFQVFKANEKANDATQAKCKHVDGHRPPVHQAHVCPHVDLSVSQFHARDSRDRRAGSTLERRDAATRARSRAVCGVHRTTPPPGPGARPRDPGSAGDRSGYLGNLRF